jgi:hypothetical protein
MAIVRSEQMNSGKKAAVAALFAVSSLIVLAGLAFGVYAWVYHVSYSIFSTDVPGVVFAAVVVFLGVRYFLSVIKMNKTLKGTKAAFSWNNFKPAKSVKKVWRDEKNEKDG